MKQITVVEIKWVVEIVELLKKMDISRLLSTKKISDIVLSNELEEIKKGLTFGKFELTNENKIDFLDTGKKEIDNNEKNVKIDEMKERYLQRKRLREEKGK